MAKAAYGSAATEDELAWVERVLAGDRAESRRLFGLVAPIFARMGRATLGPSSTEVDDFIQDASLQFYRALFLFRGESRLRWFAFRVARHTATAWIRNRRTLKRANEQVGVPEEVADPGSASGQVEQRDLCAEIFDVLNPQQLEVFLLRSVMGLTIEEIAERTDVPINTVRSRLRRAKRALRERVMRNPELRTLLGGERGR
ncbi:MAG: sigma-70 family RNA polymerase sigma factor [Myxococcota bacterium]